MAICQNIYHHLCPSAMQKTLITIATPWVVLLLGLVMWCLLFLSLRLRKGGGRFSGLLRHGPNSTRVSAVTFAGYLQPRIIITIIAIVFYVYPGACGWRHEHGLRHTTRAQDLVGAA